MSTIITVEENAVKVVISESSSKLIEVTQYAPSDVAKALSLTGALGSDQTYKGITIKKTVGESVAFGDLLYFDWTAKKYKKADADSADTMPGVAIALEEKDSNEECLMLAYGWIRDDTKFSFGGALVYASCTAGGYSSSVPTGSGDQGQVVGYACGTHTMFFAPCFVLVEVL